MNKAHLKHTIEACLKNSERLLTDAQMLELSEPPSTAFALVIIAQEELAKAFILALVYNNLIQFNEFIWRAARDHKCKHLLLMVMDFLNPDWDEFMARNDAWYTDIAEGILPRQVADALNILRHDKIGKWESRNWFWIEPPNYGTEAKKVADGYVDKWKQDQLYIKIGKDGTTASRRVVTHKQFEDAMERATRLSFVVKDMLENKCVESVGCKLIIEAFQMLFKRIKSDVKGCIITS